MKCTECKFYHVEKDCDGDDIIICEAGGDTTNPEEDINCTEAGDEELDGS